MNGTLSSGSRFAFVVVLAAGVALAVGACKRRGGNGGTPAKVDPLAGLPVVDPSGLPEELREQFQHDIEAAHRRARDSSALGRVAMMLHAHGFHEAASAWYRKAIETAQQDGVDHEVFLYRYYLADVDLRAGQAQEALAKLNAALSVRPENVHALLRRADLMRASSTHAAGTEAGPPTAEIRRAYRQVISRDAAIAPAHFGLGMVELDSGNAAEAAALLEEAVRLAPEYQEARLALADARDKLGDAEAAANLRNEPAPAVPSSGYADPYVLRLERETSLTWAKIGRALRLVQSGGAAEAESIIRTLAQEHPDDPGVWDALGTVLLGKTVSAPPDQRAALRAEAKQHFLRAVKLDSSLHQSRINYAVVLRSEGALPSAIQIARDVIERDEEFWPGHFHLAEWLSGQAVQVAERDGPLAAQPLLDEAKEHYARTIALSPHNTYARSALARVLEREGRFVEMHDALREAVRIEPDDPGVADQLARLLATTHLQAIRDPAEAYRIASRVDEVTGGKFPEYTETLAIIYEELEDYTAALKAIRAAIDVAGVEGRGDLVERFEARKQRLETLVQEQTRTP